MHADGFAGCQKRRWLLSASAAEEARSKTMMQEAPEAPDRVVARRGGDDAVAARRLQLAYALALSGRTSCALPRRKYAFTTIPSILLQTVQGQAQSCRSTKKRKESASVRRFAPLKQDRHRRILREGRAAGGAARRKLSSPTRTLTE